MLNVLMFSGIIFLGSILLMGFCGFNAIIFMSLFTIFIVMALLNLFLLYKKNNFENNMEDTYFNMSIRRFKEKKYLKSIIYFLSYPICITGILFAIINVIYMWIRTLA